MKIYITTKEHFIKVPQKAEKITIQQNPLVYKAKIYKDGFLLFDDKDPDPLLPYKPLKEELEESNPITLLEIKEVNYEEESN